MPLKLNRIRPLLAALIAAARKGRGAALLVLLASSWIAGCSTLPEPAELKQRADGLASAADWTPLSVPAGNFTLAAYLSPVRARGEALTIYIEDDGLVWLDPTTLSPDPTPILATGLRLALNHRSGPAAYLARPCQFVAQADRGGCNVAYWTEARFAPAVIDATNAAIDVLKKKTGTARVVLVGYSGGGAVAALAASKRNDVDRLVTVAGNLDHATWTRLQGLPPLTGSLNPADAWRALDGLSQVHFVGDKDTVVDGRVAAAYAGRFTRSKPRIITMEGFDHVCCWVDAWPQLQADAFSGPR